MQQRSLDLALELERTNRARVDVGQSPPLDLVAAQAEVAQRRENLIVARTNARQAEDLLRTLIVDPKRDRLLERQARTGRASAAGRRAAGRRCRGPAGARRAHRHRAGRKEIQNGDTNIALAKNQTLPDLRAQANYLTNGAGGSRLLRTGGFPGTIVGHAGHVVRQRAGAAVRRRLSDLDGRPVASAIRSATAPRRRTSRAPSIERDQSAARLRSLELTAVREVRDAALRLEQNQQRIETTRLGRELAEQRLDAEQRRFEVGLSTSFLVIQAQRDLAVARNNEQRSYSTTSSRRSTSTACSGRAARTRR